MAIVSMSVSKRHSSCKWPRGDSHLFWYHSAQVCESSSGIHFVHFFFPGKSNGKRQRYCFCSTTLNPSVFCSNPFRACLLTELCSLPSFQSEGKQVPVFLLCEWLKQQYEKKKSTTNRKILWYKIRLVRFSTEMHKPEGIAICLISWLIRLLFPHLVLPPVPIQTYWPAQGSAQLSPQKSVSNYGPCRYSFRWGIIKSLLPAAHPLP